MWNNQIYVEDRTSSFGKNLIKWFGKLLPFVWYFANYIGNNDHIFITLLYMLSILQLYKSHIPTNVERKGRVILYKNSDQLILISMIIIASVNVLLELVLYALI